MFIFVHRAPGAGPTSSVQAGGHLVGSVHVSTCFNHTRLPGEPIDGHIFGIPDSHHLEMNDQLSIIATSGHRIGCFCFRSSLLVGRREETSRAGQKRVTTIAR